MTLPRSRPSGRTCLFLIDLHSATSLKQVKEKTRDLNVLEKVAALGKAGFAADLKSGLSTSSIGNTTSPTHLTAASSPIVPPSAASPVAPNSGESADAERARLEQCGGKGQSQSPSTDSKEGSYVVVSDGKEDKEDNIV